MKKQIRITFLASIGIGVLSCSTANYAGVCVDKLNFFDEAAAINKARASVIFTQNAAANRSDIKASVYYSDMNDFLRKNPNCCSLVQHGRDYVKIPFFEKVSGRIRGFVLVRYLSKTKNGTDSEYKNSYFAVTNCGKIWEGR